MAMVFGDNARETSTAPGTSAFTVNGATPGAVSFASYMSTGDTTTYGAKSGSAWESGVLTRNADSTLSRSVKKSSNSNAAVNFTGTVDLYCDLPAWFTDTLFKGRRNHLVNPNGAVRQNAVGSKADLAYLGFDQWLALSQTGAIADSQLTNVENGTPFMMRLTQSQASAQRFGFLQWIDKGSAILIRGEPVTFSARVRLSTSANLRMAIVEWTGTADTITKDCVNDWTSGTYTAGNFFTSTTTTVTAVSAAQAVTAATLTTIQVTGTISSSANNIAVLVWTEGTAAQNVTLDLARGQLELGLTATGTIFRSDADEIALCNRYFQKSWDLGTDPGTPWTQGLDQFKYSHPSASFSASVTFPRMRTTPTLTVYDAAGATNKVTYFTSAWNNGGAITSTLARDNNLFVQHIIASSVFTNFGFTLDARL